MAQYNDNSIDFSRVLIGFAMGLLLCLILALDASAQPNGPSGQLLSMFGMGQS